jgi:hypothetical protein
MTNHEWPSDNRQHVWGPWMNDMPQKGKQKPTQYRKCVHPTCKAVDYRETSPA